jgi:SAM-dependent methyltransferase
MSAGLHAAMFSMAWFDTFAATVDKEVLAIELEGIARVLPIRSYPRLLDVGCGIGRIAGPLAARGYRVTGLDINLPALLAAARCVPGPQYVALDRRHLGRMRWQFDAALVLWHSLGFDGRAEDGRMLEDLARVVRPGGRMILDLFHPEWLLANPRRGEPDALGRGATSVRRWVDGSRCFHDIRYADGSTDDIQFALYEPDEIAELAHGAGWDPGDAMAWLNPTRRPESDCARYQLVCTNRHA